MLVSRGRLRMAIFITFICLTLPFCATALLFKAYMNEGSERRCEAKKQASKFELSMPNNRG